MEGPKGTSESEMLGELLNLTAELGVIMYKSNGEDIFRMKC